MGSAKSGRTSQFTLQQQDEIVRAYVRGMKTAAICEQFGCSNSYPGQLARRRGHPGRVSQKTRDVLSAAARRRERPSPPPVVAAHTQGGRTTVERQGITLPRLKCLEEDL